MNYTVLGAGRIGSALIHGMITSGLASGKEITVACSTPESSTKAALLLGAHAATSHSTAVLNADIVFLCVKPYQARSLLPHIAEELSEKLIISLVAGIKSSEIQTLVGGKARVIRSMPNTALRLRKGVTALAPDVSATQDDLNLAMKVFSSLGRAVIVSERDFDIVTAVSGSGPAFALLALEALSRGGVEGGLEPDVAQLFAAGALAAAASLVIETNESPATLRSEITSPNGTTAAGLKVMEEEGFSGIILRAVHAARNRANELSAEG